MSQLTPTDFARIYSEYGRLQKQPGYSFAIGLGHLQRNLPTEADDDAYNAWTIAQRKAEDRVDEASLVPSLQSYRDMIRTTTFTNVDAVAQLNGMLNRGVHPHIPVGHRRGVAYRLVPNTTHLGPTKEVDWSDDKHIYPEMFLGINITASTTSEHSTRPSRSRAHNLTDESTQSGDSDTPNDESGFTFYQLGALQYTLELDDPSTTDIRVITSKQWMDTGYVLVVKIGAAGNAEDIYMLFNYQPEDENGNRNVVAECGYLPLEEHLAGGRIAENIQALGSDFEIQIDTDTHNIKDQYELQLKMVDDSKEKGVVGHKPSEFTKLSQMKIGKAFDEDAVRNEGIMKNFARIPAGLFEKLSPFLASLRGCMCLWAALDWLKWYGLVSTGTV